MDNQNKERLDRNQINALWVILSALGVLAMAVVIGILMFYPNGESVPTQPDLTSESTDTGREEFDAVEWVREAEEYPGLEEQVSEVDDFIVVEPEEAVSAPEPVVEKKIEPVKDVVKQTETKPEPTPVVKTVKTIVYWVQVGSYSSSAKADSVREMLNANGLSGNIQTGEVNGKTYYRVRIGAFDSKTEASNFLEKLKDVKGMQDSYIVESYMNKTLSE